MADFVVGVDGCPSGWFAARIGADDSWSVCLHRTVFDLWHDRRDASLVLIDIPIGLRERGRERACDTEARKHLGRRASSVFPAPCRAALTATSFRQASAISQRMTRRKLSKQSYNILPKIDEVDRLLQGDRRARRTFREIHPEILFWAFAGRRPMQHPKKSDAGFQERRALLESLWRHTGELVDFALATSARGAVGRDDVLDALAAAITARGGRHGLRTLPDSPERDGIGLPMEMVWRPVSAF